MELAIKAKELATFAHDNLCRYDNTELCAWMYEFGENKSPRWQDWAHERWLKAAEALLKTGADFETIKATILAFRSL